MIAAVLRRRLTSHTVRAASANPRSLNSASSADVAQHRIRAYCAGLEELCHRLSGQRPREEEALSDVAAALTQEIELLDRFDPLGDHAFPQSMRHDDDGLDESRRGSVLRHFFEEGAVDFHRADRVLPQVRE